MVYIPTSVTFEYITGNAFMDCKRLKEVKYSQSLATIGDSIFMGCESLQSAFLYDSAIEILRSYAWKEFYKISNSKMINDNEVGEMNVDTVVSVYNVSGALVYQGKYGEMPTLRKDFTL